MEMKLKDIRKDLKEETVLVLPFFLKKDPITKIERIDKEIKNYSKIAAEIIDGEGRFIVFGKRKIILFNVGEKQKWNQRKFILIVRNFIKIIKNNRIKQAAIFFEEIIPEKIDLHNLTSLVSESILMADYDFNRYKKKPKEGWPEIKSIDVIWPDTEKYQKDFNNGKIIGEAVNYSRDLVNIPGGDINPESLTKEILKNVKDFKNIKAEIFDERKLKELKMGGILGVAQGSVQKPRLIILKYFGKKNKIDFDLSFVGKGVTFDSGGLDIKPSQVMDEMYMDMAGGAAVSGAIMAIAKIKIPLNIVVLIPAVENMPSGRSFKPGDILKSYNGTTIEVKNTDAEGRIILADALSYSASNFKPKMIIDVATLTGAAMVALGQRASGIFTNLDKKEGLLRQIGENSGDYVWPLPCWEEYEEEIKGTFGDISNMGNTLFGGAITGAVFLKNFIENKPWVHLDISPTMASIEGQGLAKGASGSGVRYLVEFARQFKKLV